VRTEEHRRRRDSLEGWDVEITAYRIGETCYCHVDNVSPGATVSRAEAATIDEAERQAVDKARERLRQTRRVAR
jgi:hypothetical protein